MKFKYQQGGFIPPFGIYQSRPRPTVQKKAEKTTSSKASDKDLGMKDVVELLGKIKGLPGDVKAVQSRVQQLVQNIERKLQSPEGYYGHSSSIASEYMELLNLAGTLTQHDSYYQEAKKNAIAKGSMNEVAIDSMGRIKVFDKYSKKYKWITIDEYNEDAESFRPVTNAELLDSRFNGTAGLAFDTETVTAVSDGVSLKSIQDKINNQLQGIESDQLSKTGYVSNQDKEVLKGIKTFKEVIKSGSGPNVFAEKITSKDQANQISYAFSYVYSNLTTKEKALLEFNSRHIKGGVMGLISQLIASRQGVTYEYTPVDQDPTKKGSGSGKDDKDIINEFNMNPAELIEAGYGRRQNIVIQTPKGKDAALLVPAVSLPLMDSKKGPLGASTTLADVAEGAYNGYLDFTNMSMGGGMIEPEGASNVVVNGGVLYTAYLPVVKNSQNIKPDLGLLERYKKATDEIKKLGIQKDYEKVNQYLKEKELPLMYDKEGKVIVTNYAKFAMMNGQAIDTAFTTNVALEEWLTEITDLNKIQNSLYVIGKKLGKDIDFDSKSWWDEVMPFWNESSHLYKGTIFIPVNNDDVFSRMVGAGQYPDAEEAKDLSARNQAQNRGKAVTIIEEEL